MAKIEWVEVDPAEWGVVYGPACPGPQSHRWELTIDDSGAAASSGCTDCDSWMEGYMLAATMSGTLTFEHEHQGQPCPNYFGACDCSHWWRFTPKQAPLPSTAQVTEYRLSLLPEEHDDWHTFVVTVIKARGGDWYVLRGTPSSPTNRFLHPDGYWRSGVWDDAPSYDLDTALRLADEALPLIAYHGVTAADVLAAREADQEGGQ